MNRLDKIVKHTSEKIAFFSAFFGFLSIVMVVLSFSYIAAISISNILFIKIVLVILFSSPMIFLTFRNFYVNKISISKYSFLMLLPYVIICVQRLPFLWPMHDDLVLYLPQGGYFSNIWTAQFYKPLGGIEFLPPLMSVMYHPFVEILGIRASIGLLYVLTSFWLNSIFIRILSAINKQSTKFLVTLFAMIIAFLPYIVITEMSLMTDFPTLVLSLEVFYQFYFSKNKTVAVLLFILLIYMKQSTTFFVIPLFLFFTIRYIKKIDIKYIIYYALISSFYFLRLQIETGNLLFGALNSIFKSSYYPIADKISNTTFGPKPKFLFPLWPFYGLFTSRFSEGSFSISQKVVFSALLSFTYITSIIWGFLKRKLTFIIIFLSFLAWSYVSGYSRYHISLLIVSIVYILIYYDKARFIISIPKWMFLATATIILSLPLFWKFPDFAWRPVPTFRASISKGYISQIYLPNLRFIFKDTPKNIAESIKSDFKDNDTLVFIYRGPISFYAYLASLNGLNIINGYTKEDYRAFQSDIKINSIYKENQNRLMDKNKFLIAVQKNNIDSLKTLYIPQNVVCIPKGDASSTPYISPVYYFNNIDLLECVKKEK